MCRANNPVACLFAKANNKNEDLQTTHSKSLSSDALAAEIGGLWAQMSTGDFAASVFHEHNRQSRLTC